MTYCETVANIPGSRLRAAQLNDDRYLAEVEMLHEKLKRQHLDTHPPLESFTPEVQAIYDLSDDIRLLIRAMTGSDTLEFRERPLMPIDRIKERKKQISLRKIAEIRGEEVS